MRGFNMSRKHREVKRWVQSEKFIFGCLLETRVQAGNFRGCMEAALPGWAAMANYNFNLLGRIWFCWSDKVVVTRLHSSSQVITCAIQIPETREQFICSAVYASNNEVERRALWADLRGTQAAYHHLDLPWIVIGDFNVTLSSAEHSRGGATQSSHLGMRFFQEAVGDCNLTDMASSGALFTWWNKRDEDPIGKKLDRALINTAWFSDFPHSTSRFEAGGISDHARCVVQLSASRIEARKPFRFFNLLTEHKDFLPVVQRIWGSTQEIHHSRSALARFHAKLKMLKYDLRLLNKTHFGDLPNRTKQAYEELCRLQNLALIDPCPATFAAEAEASDKWHNLARVEEKFFHQKSYIRWMGAGDQNTVLFHRSVQTRNAGNSINVLVNEAGDTLTNPEEIKTEAVLHFQKFLQMQDRGNEEDSLPMLQELISYRCTPNSDACLVAPVSAEEIVSAIQALPKDKVSGPDGFTKEFFVAAWPVIGKEFIISVQSFFLFGFLPTGINATILALIPKSVDAQSMKDYRPIACCNFLYKVIAKILARRLRTILLEAIELNQSAFIKGRLLLENVLLASELVNGYHKTTNSNRATIKLDISKVFDTVKWSFITAVLRAMSLPAQFILWIRVCISTAAFSVSVNGCLEGFFTSARGIRQGCSLSPYLYVILNNVLSKMLNRAAEEKQFSYHHQCMEVKLTHLSFADDILVFTDGSSRSLRGVLKVMDQFARIYGLHINASKSSLYASGQTVTPMLAEAERIGLKIGKLPIIYLGMPLTTKALTKQEYEPLIDKVRRRMLSWKNKCLSYAGRLQLIKSVISSIVNFWSQAFILPKACLNEIEGMCSAFLWSGSPHQSHKAKVAWEDLCCPKEEGGLGIRKLRDSSKVFALSLIWRIVSRTSSLWVSWIQQYLLRQNYFWDVREDGKGSWIWRKLLKLRPLAYQFIRIQVNDGCTAFFWFDNWLQTGKLIDITGAVGTCYLGIPRNAKVCDAVLQARWNVRGHRSRHFSELHARIQREPVPDDEQGHDVTLWKHAEDDYKPWFSSKRTWEQIREHKASVTWSKTVWFAQGVPRFSFMVWLVVKNRLAIGDRMRAWGLQQSCVLCGERDETRDHLFFACPYSFTVWNNLAGRLSGFRTDPDWEITLQFLTSNSLQYLDKILLKLVFQTSIYHIWQERNKRKHHTGYRSVDQLIRLIDKAVRNRISSLRYGAEHKLGRMMQRWDEASIMKAKVEAKAGGKRYWRLQKEIHEFYGVEKQEMEDRSSELPAAKNYGGCVYRFA
ncbi:uncharacterized protein LOC108845015 [Raphanus sativus]|uniref:Uncharacterized protein LOC108845015 n=1 Tax=Raphanus sativus TaxID=3726 RepID=A0A6J0MMS5_RAPSA|nr:uncharacterized protein LOC108845015 [Raphanus sativus]